MDVMAWLLDGDPAIRWQVLRDLTDASGEDVAAERARVEHEGWLLGDLFRRAGAAPDPRMTEAVEVVRSKCQADGRWLLDRIYPGRVHFDIEAGVSTPSRWNTLRPARAHVVGRSVARRTASSVRERTLSFL